MPWVASLYSKLFLTTSAQFGDAKDVGSSFLRAFDAVIWTPCIHEIHGRLPSGQLLQMIAGEDLD